MATGTIRRNNGGYEYISERVSGSPDSSTLLIRTPYGFEPVKVPASRADVVRVERLNGRTLRVIHYTGESSIYTRVSADFWQGDAPDAQPPTPPVPPAPTLAAIPNQTILYGEVKQIPITWTGTGVKISISANDSLHRSIPSGQRSIRLRPYVRTTFTVRVRATDSRGRYVERTLTVYCPRLPTMTPLANVQVPVGGNRFQAWTLTGDEPISFRSTISNSNGRSYTSRNGIRVYGDRAGSATVRAYVRDRHGQETTRSFTITFNPPAAIWRWPFPRSAISPGRHYHAGHFGLDFGYGPAQNNAPIRSIGSGTVVYAGWMPYDGAGWTTIIDHGNVGSWGRVFSHYNHMIGTPPVSVGARVDTNTVIGRIGNTGNSFGAHLHLQLQHIQSWGQHFDPAAFLDSVGAVGG